MSVRSEMLKIYGGAYEQYGDDPRTFLHSNEETQLERFSMLGRLFAQETEPFTVHEIGCALGHFGYFLRERFPLATFSGSDIYAPFVESCQKAFPNSEFVLRDITESLPPEQYDYVVTCGTFNIINEGPRQEWQQFIYSMLGAMHSMARKGIGATFLTIYHDLEKRRADLFYQDERELMNFTAEHLSRHFELDAMGPLYEYCLRVYQPEYIRSQYPQSTFDKYFKPKSR